MQPGLGISLGIAIGVAFGVALDSLGLGMAIGVALGGGIEALSTAQRAKTKAHKVKDGDEEAADRKIDSNDDSKVDHTGNSTGDEVAQ